MQALDAATFTDAMVAAVEEAQVGFYFEEGGCWGMAAALFETLTRAGHNPIIKYTPTDFIHAWVEVDAVAYDYRGATTPQPNSVAIPLEELGPVAKRYGYDEEEFISMTADAQPIVDAAWADYRQRTSTI